MIPVTNYRFKFPLFPYTVDIVIGKAMAKRYVEYHEARWCKPLGVFIDGYCSGFVSPVSGTVNYIVGLPEEYDPITVAHEAIHLANQLWDEVGADLQVKNDEVLTYTCDYIHRYIRKVCYDKK